MGSRPNVGLRISFVERLPNGLGITIILKRALIDWAIEKRINTSINHF